VSQLAWRAFDGLYRPWVEFSDGADEELANLRKREVPQIFAFNHPTNIHDQFNSAATLLRIDPATVGNTRVLTKDPLIKGLNRFAGLADALGGIPVFRKKDNGDNNLLETANEKMFDAVALILEDKQNLAIYPEGTHNKNHPSVLGTVRSGIGEIATRVVAMYEGSEVAITPIGMAYGRIGKWQNPHHATVIVGNPFIVSPHDTVESVTESTKNRLQQVVTVAYNKHPQI
jgi:1-acyl-sn-glycerol-3-phosphate acyltransferase